MQSGDDGKKRKKSEIALAVYRDLGKTASFVVVGARTSFGAAGDATVVESRWLGDPVVAIKSLDFWHAV
jgi:hypothetical protein